ncbi:hypothetical protein J2X45_003378 [Caulobacter sp. BE264]|nr:hypothetical protein [Caulobacter sp. BE264]
MRVLLIGRADTACPCGRGERYTVTQGEVLAEPKTFSAGEHETRRRQIGRARLHLEIASEQLDRAFDQVDALGDRMGI